MSRLPDPILVDAVDEAQCPTCTRPLEALDDAEMDAYGLPADLALCLCERCAPDAEDCLPAFLVSWREETREDRYGDLIAVRVERARQVGRFDADGDLRPSPEWMDSLRTRARRAEMVWRRWDKIAATLLGSSRPEDRAEKNRRRYHVATEMLVALCMAEAGR